MPKKKLIVAYCRVSTFEQKKGYGIPIQMRDIALFAKRQGLSIDTVYKDEGESGVAENRRALKRLLRHCKKGLIRAVIIPSLERWSREVRLAENLFWMLERMGVQVYIADMPFYNSKDRRDVLLRQIREAIAEENRKDIIERLWKGRQERTRKGKPSGGNIPYGYQRIEKRFAPNPEEQKIVRIIFDSDSHGKSGPEIAAILNTKGYTRRNGQPWVARQVSSILERHDLYTKGMVRYGGATGKDTNLILVMNRGADT